MTAKAPRPAGGSEAARLLQRGRELYQAGQLAEAEKALGMAVRRDAGNANALYILALIAFQRADAAQALKLISRAIGLRPDIAALYANRAAFHVAQGAFDLAMADHDQALALAPDQADYHAGRAEGLARLERLDEAVAGFETALALKPSAAIHGRFGGVLRTAGRFEAAAAQYAAAIALEPDTAAFHTGLGNALYDAGAFERALAPFETAVALEPDNPVAHYNRGNACRVLARAPDALASFEAAAALDPDFAVAHHNRAVMLLQRGDLAAGFEALEWRKRCPGFDDPRYGLAGQAFDPGALAGRTLFIYPEYFKGDLIQFCRYVPLAQQHGARVVLAAPTDMHRLLQTVSPTLDLLPPDAAPPQVDLACALVSLPHLFGTTLDTVPGQTPYLRAEPERLDLWRARIGEGGFKVGVAWQGATLAYAARLQRSFALAALEGLSRIAGVRLISLQKHDGLDQLLTLPDGMTVETLGEDFDSGDAAFVDTAAVMVCCDLVITPDTSLAHLAGALGVRAWVALPSVADWRWLTERADSPWYPSARLFRQTQRQDWAGVFAQMEAALRAELGGAR